MGHADHHSVAGWVHKVAAMGITQAGRRQLQALELVLIRQVVESMLCSPLC